MGFFVGVALIQGRLPTSIQTQTGQELSAVQLFLYPALGTVTFAGAMVFGRQMYFINRYISYRILVAGGVSQLLWILLAYWTVRQF